MDSDMIVQFRKLGGNGATTHTEVVDSSEAMWTEIVIANHVYRLSEYQGMLEISVQDGKLHVFPIAPNNIVIDAA